VFNLLIFYSIEITPFLGNILEEEFIFLGIIFVSKPASLGSRFFSFYHPFKPFLLLF
jgi:hypothetical protein